MHPNRGQIPKRILEKANAFVLSVFFVISDSPATLVWSFPLFVQTKSNCVCLRIVLVCGDFVTSFCGRIVLPDVG